MVRSRINRYDAILVDGALPSVVHNIWVSSHTVVRVINSTTALPKSRVLTFESWFELLRRLT